MRFHAKRAGAVVASLVLGLGALAVDGSAQASTAHFNHANSYANGRHHHAFNLAFQINQVFTSTVTAGNQADAHSTDCHGCRSVAIAFQIVADGRVPSHVYASNHATSVNKRCVGCQTLGTAFQFIVAKPVVLSAGDWIKLGRIQWELWNLQWSNAPVSDVASQVSGLAGQVAAILANADSGSWPSVHHYAIWQG